MKTSSLANSILHYFFFQPSAVSPKLLSHETGDAPATTGAATPASRSGPLVLVAESNAAAARRISSQLQTLGVRSKAVASGAACLAEAPKCRPDVVLMDMGLIYAEGINAMTLRNCAAKAGNPPIIFLDGAQDEDAVSRVRAYFTKIQRHQQIADEVAAITAGGTADAGRIVDFGLDDLVNVQAVTPTADEPAMAGTDLAGVVRLASWVFQPVAANKQISLTLDVPDSRLMAACDEVRIQRVLENLLSNAIKASPTGSSITVAAREENGWLRFWVDDAGPGVPEFEQSSLFDEPASFMDVLHSDDGGSNRGLLVCQHIVTRYGGEMAMQNRRNGGAHFEFRLPAAANSSTRSSRPDLVTMNRAAVA